MTLPTHYFFTLHENSSFTGTPGTGTSANFINQGIGSHSSCWTMRSDETVSFDVSSSSLTSGWITFSIANGTNYAPDLGTVLFLAAGATTDLLRLKVDDSSSGTLRFEYWDGAAWALIGSTISLNLGTLNTAWKFDIRFIIANSGGEFSLYQDGGSTALASLTSADTLTTADTDFDTLVTRGLDSSQLTYFGPLIMDSADTRDLWFDEIWGTSNGSLQEWNISAESNVDEQLSGTTLTTAMSNNINHDTSGDRVTHNNFSLRAEVTGKTIEGVVIGAIAQGVGNPALFIDAIVRISTTVYQSSSPGVQPVVGAADIYYWEFEDDPSTSLPWANAAAVDAIQVGFITATSA